ncbi:hypothetical protein VaNZ11_007931 [Volvox africanus]|uniref:Uncharacterized protein n=1 Tax=Volvox africanus TaxID=51714 RepID=A0ABQ5S3Z9_9CHLO|nr:hypothetical protein VaNZ11_007931 [Volvox africanus]
MATIHIQNNLARWNIQLHDHQPWTARRIVRSRCPMHCRPDPNLRARPYIAHYMTVRALPSVGMDVLLKGPTLSELFSYGQAAISLAGAAWHAIVAPFEIFGSDQWGLNFLFYFTVLLMAYNLVFQAPKQ